MWLLVKKIITENVFWVISALALASLLLFFLLIYFYFKDFPFSFLIFIKGPTGERFYGGIDDIFKYGIFGLSVFLINIGLGYYLMRRIKKLSYFLAILNFIVQIIILIVLLQIYSLN